MALASYYSGLKSPTPKSFARGLIEQIESKSIAIWDKIVRLSLAGVQAKLPVIIKDNKIGLGNGTLSSTHIIKFQTKTFYDMLCVMMYDFDHNLAMAYGDEFNPNRLD